MAYKRLKTTSLFCVNLTLLLLTPFTRGTEYLFRQSPGGDGYRSPGMWGGPLSPGELGKARDLYIYGYESLNVSEKAQYGIEIEYLSFDPVSKRMLMVVEDPEGIVTSEKHSLAFGGLCKDSMADLHATFHTFKLVDKNNPYLIDSDCGWKCGWGPFAYYDSKVYFVLSGVFGKSYINLQREIQIREMYGCEDIINDMTNSKVNMPFEFPVLECSRLIITLYEETYAKPIPQISRWAAQDLKVIMKDGHLHLFLQMFYKNIANSDSSIELLHIDIINANSWVEISQSPIESVYSGNVQFTGIGAIDYKDGILCWTVTDRLLCGLYNLDHTQVQETLILHGQTAVEERICQTGNLPIESLQYTITGVAISDTAEALSIYFGCYANLQATGGVGLVRVSHHGLSKQIYPIKSGSSRVYGGYVFLSDTVDVSCDYSTSSSHGQEKTSSRSPGYTSGSIPSVSAPPGEGDESLPNVSLAAHIHYTATMTGLMVFTALFLTQLQMGLNGT